MFKRSGLKTIPNQGKEGSCTAYATCSIINGFKEPKYKEQGLERDALDGSEYFALVNSKYPADLQGPLTSVQSLLYAKENGFIKHYEKIDLPYDKIVSLLKAGFLFLVKITKCDWTATEKKWICQKATKSSGIGHQVALVDYDDEDKVFKFVNSRGPEWGDGGYFYMKYEDMDYFVSEMYVVLDNDDNENFARLSYKAKIMSAINILSQNRKRGTEDEQKAMNFSATMLRKVILGQDHQYNMEKSKIIAFINKYLLKWQIDLIKNLSKDDYEKGQMWIDFQPMHRISVLT